HCSYIPPCYMLRSPTNALDPSLGALCRMSATLLLLSPTAIARATVTPPHVPQFLPASPYTVNVPARPDAGLLSATANKFTVSGQLTVQQVIPGDGDTEVPLAAQLFVQFSRSVAPLTTLSAQRADPVVTFEPALHGTGEWL